MGSVGQKRQAADRRVALFPGEPRQEFLDTRRVEDRCCFADADARGGQSDVHAPTIRVVPQTRDVTFALETIERQRHRCRHHPHVPREVVHSRRIEFVQVIEDARLVAAEQATGDRIANVSGVAGEVDAGVERQDLSRCFGNPNHLARVIDSVLFCQTKIK